MPAIDYIPRPDADFDAWQASFLDYAAKHATTLGLRDATLEELHQLQKKNAHEALRCVFYNG